MNEKNTYFDDLGSNNLPESIRINPFVVPSDFFSQQEEEILNQIKLQEQVKPELNLETSIPSNYFAELENSIIAKISEQNLKEMVPTDGFTTPENYFDSFEVNIKNSILIDELKTQISDTGFVTPDNYFSTLEDSINNKISENELKSLIQQDGFTVPSNYFVALEQSVLDKVEDNNRIEDNITPIITLTKRKTNWAKYSAAAVLLLIGIGSYFGLTDSSLLSNQGTNNFVTGSTNFEKVSDEELVHYLAQVSDDANDLLYLAEMVKEENDKPLQLKQEVDEDDIKEYLNYML